MSPIPGGRATTIAAPSVPLKHPGIYYCDPGKLVQQAALRKRPRTIRRDPLSLSDTYQE